MSKPFKELLDKMSPESRRRIKEKADIIRREQDLRDSVDLGKEGNSDDRKNEHNQK